MWVTTIIFVLVYVALCIGRLPGFKVDRTGAVVIGSFAMIAFGSLSSSQAWSAISYDTIGMLFGLMVVSSSFIVSGFYDWIAHKLGSLPLRPSVLLFVFILVGGGLSALLTNDVVIVAMMPLLVAITLSRGLNPTPFLLGFCFATNTVATFSLLGSPQNMIIAQELNLTFMGLMMPTLLPALLSIPLIWCVLVLLYRSRWSLARSSLSPSSTPSPSPHEAMPEIPLNIPETIKAGIVTCAVVVAFIFSSIPHELISLGAAGFLLLSRKVSSKDMLKQVDGNLILLIMGLFVVNEGFALTGFPEKMVSELSAIHLNLNQPMTLFWITSGISNVVGNNPAVMLLIPFLTLHEHMELIGAALAFGTGFSSNMFIFGSLAGIIVVEQAKRYNVVISFAEFSTSGVIIALSGLILCALNLWLFTLI